MVRKVWFLLMGFCLFACDEAGSDLSNLNWDTYLGDTGRQHYSPLSQINRNNVAKLEEVWRYRSGDPDGLMYTSPIVIDGILYGLSPSLDIFALNAATGEELWRNELGLSGGAQRGLMWWHKEEDRRILFAAGKELIAIDADTGDLISSFGDQGKLDMTPSLEGR